MSRIFLIASGKGGVGKSVLTAALGTLLAQSGSSVVIVDADMGLRSQDQLLGLENRVVYDLLDVIHGDCDLEEALLPSPECERLRLLPCAQFTRAKALDAKSLRKVLSTLSADNSFVLIDCPAGLERGLRNVINTKLCEAILTVTPDDLCIRDAERLAALLREKDFPQPLLIVNRVRGDLIRSGEMHSARTVAETLDLPLLGEVPEDDTVYRAQLRGRTFAAYDCEARRALIRISRRIRNEKVPFSAYGTVSVPMRRRLFPKELKEVTFFDS